MSELEAPERPSETAAPVDTAADATDWRSTWAMAGAAVSLAACGGGGGGETGTTAVASGTTDAAPSAGQESSTTAVDNGPAAVAPVQPQGYRYPVATSDAEAARFLQQVQFASTPTDIAALRGRPFAEWLQQQFAQPQGGTGWDWLNAQGYGDPMNTASYFDNTYPADHMVWSQLLDGNDPVRRRLALALSEFFVVSSVSMDVQWRSHAMAHWWDTLVNHALGNFRQLLEAVSLNPAMGHFLNTRGNQKENPATGRVPDENYAREVMQLFTIGLYALHEDGSVQTGASGLPLDSYTQSDVTQLARAFTGYDYDRANDVQVPRAGGGTIFPPDFARRPMKLNPSRHSTGPIQFLRSNVDNTSGATALAGALDVLFNHPNVGPFFGRQMIQRLVTSNPSPAYVARVAAAFNDNGQGVRGDLRAVWAAVLLDDEARHPVNPGDTQRGKLREPILRFVQWARSFGVTSQAGTWKVPDLSNASTQLGQSPLRSPSVFNFFRPGYVPPSTALATVQAVAPEFQLVNETTVGGYLNFMQTLIRDGWLSGDIKANYATELTRVGSPTALLDHLNLVLCAGQLAPVHRQTMVDALGQMAITTDAQKLNRVAAAVLMVMASSGYLVQK